MKKEEFVERANIIHNGKFDYSLVEDTVSSEVKTKIICPKHGVFEQTPHSHLRGKGCKQCYYESKRNTLEYFLKKAKKIHGDKYNYDKVEYINAVTPITITCPIHGDFEITPTCHTDKKQGCKLCGREEARLSKQLGLDNFIRISNKMHNNKYKYDKSKYINNYTNLTITCPIHGDFEQTPHAHMRGQGCPHCKDSHLERTIIKALNSENIEYIHQYKDSFLEGQSLDFFIPKLNIGIECQGKQHITGRWFKKSYTRDETDIIQSDYNKKEKCNKSSIKLFYFFEPRYGNLEILKEDKYKGLYNEENSFTSVKELLKKIKEQPN